VYGVPALQDGHLCRGLEEVLQTDWAVLVHCVLDARVRVTDLIGVATATRITVEEVLAATHTADAALVAVEDLLLDTLVVPEVTVLAEVIPENLTTGHA